MLGKIKQIIGVFETGKPQQNYSTVALLEDGAGISYGAHQATDRSGTLDRILYQYLDLGGRYAQDLRGYLDLLARDETAKIDPQNPPAWVSRLMGLLSVAGSDPLMVQAQEEVFDSLYFTPALAEAERLGLTCWLSRAVICDTWIHSGPNGLARIRRLFPEVPPLRGGDEKEWVTAYVKARRAWLADHPTRAVRATTYRMDFFLAQIRAGNWNLDRPVRVLGVVVE